jgi:ribosome biogenesis protein Nip4
MCESCKRLREYAETEERDPVVKESILKLAKSAETKNPMHIGHSLCEALLKAFKKKP